MPRPFHTLPEAFLTAAGQLPGSVLLATGRCDDENFRSFLFTQPADILIANRPDELPQLFARIAQAQQAGAFVAGYFAYECGEHFTGVKGPGAGASTAVLAWLGIYPRPCVFDHRTGSLEGTLPALAAVEPAPAQATSARFGLDALDYARQIEAIHELIRSGDTYQVNFTAPLEFACTGSAIDLFRSVAQAQPVPYAAFLNLGPSQILSFSPELFFRVEQGQIVTRPMKGTAPRGRTAEEDQVIAAWLAGNLKNRSENVMIVDLLRNDLGRVCGFGSVRAERLFAVERYETLFQMVSTVSGRLRPGVGPYELFTALFPSGSITGTPKIRTMQIIGQLERAPRGVYTGAIGCFAPSGDAVCSVAIRTAMLKAGQGTMGLGSGITIDSQPHDEYRECLLKAQFLIQPSEPFALLESLLWDGTGCPLIELHLDRLTASAESFGYPCDRDELRSRLIGIRLDGRHKLRLLVHRDGRIELEAAPIAAPEAVVRAVLCPEPVNTADRFLFHKTTRRAFYNQWLQRAQQLGYGEILFVNERGELTEGAISNLFVGLDGRLLTPPVECGLLPGVYRRHLLATEPRAAEQRLTPGDLARAQAIYLTNAVRGLRRVELVESDPALHP